MVRGGLDFRQIQPTATAGKAFLPLRRLTLTLVFPPSNPCFHLVEAAVMNTASTNSFPHFHVPKRPVNGITSIAKGQPRFAIGDWGERAKAGQGMECMGSVW